MLQAIRYFYNFNQKSQSSFNEKNDSLFVNKNLSIFGCYELKEYYKSKKDFERGIEKKPGENLLIYLEPCLNFQIFIDYLRKLKAEKQENYM